MSTTTTKYRGLLFAPEMARALAEGRKTQTRRAVKPQPLPDFPESCLKCHWYAPTIIRDGGEEAGAEIFGFATEDEGYKCPHHPGSIVYAKEAWWMHDDPKAFDPDDGNVTDSDGRRRVVGYAASMDFDSVRCAKEYGARKRSSLHMPRWAARTWIRITAVRVERAGDISEDDAIAEGFKSRAEFLAYAAARNKVPVEEFCKRWVWAYTFEKINRPEGV